MRGYLVSAIAIATMIVSSTLSARSQDIPTLDVKPVCRGIASQSADPGVGQGSQDQTYRQCIETEQATREQIEKEWPTFSAADKRHCVVLATTGGESSNTELLTCLEMARDVRILRSAAAASSSSADKSKPTPSPPTTTVQPPPAGTAAQPTPQKESPKTEGRLTITEVERAKAETETAKASEALTLRKLADAEAALQRAKEEAGRAIAEAERARAAAQVAKESEAAATRKLADAEAARAAAEKACTAAARPGLVGRLRGWLKHPASKSP
jgi:hypothetical protein